MWKGSPGLRLPPWPGFLLAVGVCYLACGFNITGVCYIVNIFFQIFLDFFQDPVDGVPVVFPSSVFSLLFSMLPAFPRCSQQA